MQIDQSEFKSIIDSHPREKRSLIPILQDFQSKYNYLPPGALYEVSRILCIPMIDIIDVATFYKAFSLEPKGEHQVTVCMGTACHVRGAPKILEEFERKLGVEEGCTTKDGQFSLESVACLGCCAIGPVVVVDEDYHAESSIRSADKIIKKYRKKEKEK
jgi:NADH-quinone oxidoreductase subunit E